MAEIQPGVEVLVVDSDPGAEPAAVPRHTRVGQPVVQGVGNALLHEQADSRRNAQHDSPRGDQYQDQDQFFHAGYFTFVDFIINVPPLTRFPMADRKKNDAPLPREAMVQRLSAGLESLGQSLSDEQIETLLDYLAELVRWNRAYNLTAVTDPMEMVDRNGKKVRFLRHIKRSLGLDNSEPIHARLESLRLDPPPDEIVARALAPLVRLVEWHRPWLEQGARLLAMKAQLEQAEIDDVTDGYSVEKHPLNWAGMRAERCVGMVSLRNLSP